MMGVFRGKARRTPDMDDVLHLCSLDVKQQAAQAVGKAM